VLEVKNGSFGESMYLEGETLTATCRIENARPVANISWFLGKKLRGFNLSQRMKRACSLAEPGRVTWCRQVPKIHD